MNSIDIPKSNFYFPDKYLARLRFLLASLTYFLMLMQWPVMFSAKLQINNQYPFLLIAFLFCIIDLLLSLLVGWKAVKTTDIILLILNLVLLVMIIVGYPLFGNQYLCFIISCSVALLLLARAGIEYFELGWIVILHFYFIELVIGLKELSQQINNSTFNIEGTLSNSGIYSIYIALHLPICMFFSKKWFGLRHKSIQWIIFFFVCAITLILICLNRSRTGLFVFVLAMGIVTFQLIGRIWIRLHIVKLGRVISMLIFVLLFIGTLIISNSWNNNKKLSTTGRLMGLTVIKENLTQNVFTGIGPGQISWYFPRWQRSYFAEHSDTPIEYRLSAGETYIIFNEFASLFIEWGIFVFVLMGILILIYFKNVIESAELLVRSSGVLVLSVLVAGLSYYILHVTPVFFVFQFALVYTFTPKWKNSCIERFLPVSNRNISWLNLLLSIVVTGWIGYTAFSANKWQNMQENIGSDRTEKLLAYERLYPVLSQDGKFLADYAHFLLQEGSFPKRAASLFDSSLKSFISYESVFSSAKANELSGNLLKATEQYIYLCDWLPSRFLPRFELMQFYLRVNDTINARKEAYKIFKMPIKIASPEVDIYKSAAQRLLIKYGSKFPQNSLN